MKKLKSKIMVLILIDMQNVVIAHDEIKHSLKLLCVNEYKKERQ